MTSVLIQRNEVAKQTAKSSWFWISSVYL